MTKEARSPNDEARRKRPFGIRASCFVILSSFVIPSFVIPGAAGAEDPLPLIRVQVPPERVPEAMKQAGQGKLVEVPRGEFERLLRDAARAGEALKNPPRLVETQYRGGLVETPGPGGVAEAHLSGSGHWKLNHSGDGPGLMPLAWPSIALDKPHFEDRKTALIGELDGRSLALFVEKPGAHTVAFDWSARGELRPDGLHFQLDLPASPVALLEVELPAGYLLNVTSEGCLRSGPHPAAGEGRRLWKVAFAGRPQVGLLVRRAGDSDGGPPLLAAVQTRQDVQPDVVEAVFEFELKGPPAGVGEVLFEHDPALRPFDVAAPGLDGWAPAGAGKLHVRLREPMQAGKVMVRCLAPVSVNPAEAAAWTSPGMRVVGAVPRGEVLTLRLAPGVQPERWQPGGFRLTASRTEPDGTAVLTLTGGAVESDAGVRRPSAVLRARGPEYATREVVWWQADPEQSLLAAQITWDVVRGRLLQLPVALPAGWDVDRVELTPPDLLRGVGVRPARAEPRPARATLLVELQRGVGSGDPAPTLTVWLRPTRARAGPAPGRPTAFPDVSPVGARAREGVLAVGFEEKLYDAAVTPPGRPVSALGDVGPSRDPYPWGKQPPDLYFPYRGLPAAGTLTLRPLSPRIRARCTTEVLLTAGKAAVATQLFLQPEIGRPERIEILLSSPVPEGWTWKTREGDNAVRRAERLPGVEAAPLLAALAARSPLESAALAAAGRGWTSRGEVWRLTLERPLSEPLALEAGALLPAGPGDARLDVPLVTLPGAGRTEGEVKLYLAGTNQVQVVHGGLRQPPEPRLGMAAGGAPPWRAFRYGAGPVSLALRGTFAGQPETAESVVGPAHLATRLEPDGAPRHTFAFRVWNWRQSTLPLRLPPGARPLSARVDGRWLSELSPAAAEDPAGVVLELPVPGPGQHRFEVAYAAVAPPWALATRLEAPAPHLPVPPLGFRRTWELPRGVLPLFPGALQRLPGAAGADAPGGRFGLGEMPSLAHALASLGGPPPLSGDGWAERQAEQFARAAALRPDGPATLGEVLGRLTFEGPREYGTVVVDAAALREAGVTPRVPFPPERAVETPFGPGLGLAHVACPAGPLLTTRRQQSAWESAGATPGRAPAAVEHAAAEAAAEGHDRSGRFVTAAEWVTAEASPLAAGAADTLPPEDGTGWTAWEAVTAAGEGPDSLPVVRERVALPAGVVLAALAALLVWWWGKRRDVRRVLLLVWLAAAGVAVIWVPPALAPLAWWPLAAAGFIALFGYLLSANRSERPAASSHRSGLRPAAPVLALACLAGLAGHAAPPEPPTVFLLPADEGPEKQPVLAPPELLEQVRAMARRGAAGLRGAVLLAAAYEGKAGENAVEFDAEFQAHVFGAEPAILAVPLDGVQLEELFLDGARAFATPPPGTQPGFGVRVEGAGAHTLRARFRAPLRATGEERECALTLPRLPQGRVSLTVPAGASYLHLVGRLGSQKVTAAGGTLRLEAEPGPAAGPVQLRWRQEAGPPRPPEVAVQEMYLWQLGADAATLHGILEYTVGRGTVTELEVDLPQGTEVRAVEAGPRPRLRRWHVVGKEDARRLRLEFQSPITSGVVVRLELVPQRPLRGDAQLPLPAPRDARTARGLLAYRLDGLRARLGPYLRVGPVMPADFARDWQGAGGNPAQPPTSAFLFDRKAGPPVLGLNLRPATPRLTAVQDLGWRVAPAQADFRAVLRLTAPDGDLSLVEWEVPGPVVVARVTGADVRSWSRSGNRVQVWLTRSVSQAEVHAAGWWLPAKKPEGPAAEVVWELPRTGVLAAEEQTTLFRLTAAAGHALSRLRTQQLGAWPDPRTAQPSEQELLYLTRRTDYAGSFRVQPATARTDVQTLTFAEVRDRQMVFSARVSCQSPRGELRTLTVRLRRWEGGDVRLDAPDVAQRQERRDAEGRTWALELQPGVGSRYQFTLEGVLPVADGGGVLMPEVTVDEAARTERWLAVAGPELTAEEVEGLTAAADPAEALRPWPREADRVRRVGGAAWRATSPEGGLRLVPRREAGGPDAVRVFLTEYEAAALEGRGWLHEATYWLRHEAATDLNLTLPAWARVAGVTVDGVPVTPLQRERQLWLPLPGGAGVRRLRLRWTFEDGAERLTRPNLDRPRIEGAGTGPVVWTVRVPSGYEAAVRSPAHGDLRPAALATAELWRAEAQMRLSAAVAGSGVATEEAEGSQLAASQRRFHRHWRLAEHALATAASSPPDVGPEGKPLGDWLRELDEENRDLATGLGYEDVRTEAQRQVRVGAVRPAGESGEAAESPDDRLPRRGMPLRWVGSGDVTPALDLTPLTARQRDRAGLLSALLLAVLFAAWLLSRWPAALGWAKVFWPEQVALLGCLGWLAAGPNLLFAFLCLLGACGRLILLGWWLAAALRRPTPARRSTVTGTPQL